MRRWTAPILATILGLLAIPSARADAITDANALLLDVIRTVRPGAPRATRLIAMVNVAAFDSANAAAGLPYQPYNYDGMAVRQADPAIAAAAAAAGVMLGLYPDLPNRAPALAEKIAALIPRSAKANNAAGIELGRACATAILAARARDGAAEAATPFPGATTPGAWRPTPPAMAPALLPGWGKVRPFAIASAEEFAPPGPPSIGSFAWIDGYNAVKSLGSPTGGSHSKSLAEIAVFWADDDGTETPPGHWIAIALQVSAGRRLGLVENARLFALLGTAMADSAIIAWSAKYRFAAWRPITAIREANQIGNSRIQPEPDWQPVLNTPAFPEYPSGHSTFSAAAARTLALVLGTDDIAFDVSSRGAGMQGITHHFDRLSEAAEEAGLSRIYGGIHFYFSHTDGAATGTRIADTIVATRLRPTR